MPEEKPDQIVREILSHKSPEKQDLSCEQSIHSPYPTHEPQRITFFNHS